MTAIQTAAQHRRAVRQLKGGIYNNETCVPCIDAISDRELDRIGAPAWLNDGFPDCDHLDHPVLYCCLCLHVLGAKELARRLGKGQEAPEVKILEWTHSDIEQGLFVHEDGADLDSDDAKLLQDFEVEKCGYVRTVQHLWADVKRINSWLNDCEHSHGRTCNSHRTSNTDTGSLLLVDVQDDCLFQGSFQDRYFALSYICGASTQFLTLKQNYESLLEPGSMLAQPITQTIRDAMNFVKSLGERYLWVDTVVETPASRPF